ncbi:MAG TPA: Ig-like domain-containing protein [Bacteroidales bacterium]|nr:Ig-like domain-containing protein [Bacteroidales bacterium]
MKNYIKMLGFTGIVSLSVLLFSSCEKKEVGVTGLELDKNEASVQAGATIQIATFITPADASNQNITWKSSDQSVATVEDGAVTGVAIGNVTISAISQADTAIKASCNVSVTPATGQVVTVTGDITSDTKWYAAGKYMLSGFVYVKNNATLTIEPGTVIKGVSGTKAALIVERGSKIMAQGTASSPIVFTSDKPKGQRTYGDWGGLVLCGNAPTNKHDSGAGTGIAEGGIGSLYGGNNSADNSGVLEYVRIEFPGIGLTATANSEINGLTLYSVGSGTTIDHIQISYSGDDSFEWFGGTVNCKYIVAFRGWDDDFDTDNGYNGKVQFFVGLRDPNTADQSQSNGFESDNDADGSTLSPVTSPVFVNGSLFGPLTTSNTTANALFRHAMQIRRGSRLSVYNSIFAGWPFGLYIDGAKGDSPAQATANTLQIENSVLSGMTTFYKTDATSLQNTESWFTDASRHNETRATNDLLQLNNPFSLTTPDFLPAAGSTLLSGASFTNTRLTDSFFTQVAYRGAFGSTNWTTGWCNFDPQNTDY